MKKWVATDLAIEMQEQCSGEQGEIPGVVLNQYQEECGISITKIEILNQEGAEYIGKPIGIYLTLELEFSEGEDLQGIIAKQISELVPKDAKTILIVGLGNKNMTADALGPRTVEQLQATRLIFGEETGIAAFVPGVLAQTGMESGEMVKGMIDRVHPDCLIVIDALAARSVYRVGKTIQLTNTGICPGSGIGNRRREMNQDTMGIPVIAVGIPTVVGAAAIVSDAMEALKETYDRQQDSCENLLGTVAFLDKEEYYQLVSEVLMPRIGNFFVMPKELDQTLSQMSKVLAGALQRAFSRIKMDNGSI